jgi:hypothetical protein
MISRYFLRCPGCDKPFTTRIGVDTADNTRFYLPCPICKVSIRGQMDGEDLASHRINFECEVIQEGDLSNDSPVITINPFVPSRYDADSFDGLGTFPTMTLHSLLGGERFLAFQGEHGQGREVAQELWPTVRMLFEYFLQQNWAMFEKTAINKFGVKSVGSTMHQRTTIAYQAVLTATVNILGTSLTGTDYLLERFHRKYLRAVRSAKYIEFIRDQAEMTGQLERDIFSALDQFITKYEVWAMGRLPRWVDDSAKPSLENLTLFRDEFTTARDLYQQGFEASCKCLWILMATQNSVKQDDPNNFGDTHPATVPSSRRASSIAQFNRLSNARKLAYVEMVPGWEVLSKLLASQRRNAIGHGTARHDLLSGRVSSDKDPQGVTYLRFLEETFGVFEVLAILMQVLRGARIVSSPDFGSA